MRGLLCHCRRHLEAEDDATLAEVVRDHLLREHPGLPPTAQQTEEILASRAYDFDRPAVEERRYVVGSR